MKRYIILLLALLTLTFSCKIRNIENKTETKIEYREVIRDTTIFVPADKAIVTALLACDSLGNVYLKQIQTLQGNSSASANVIIRDNYITAECLCDSINIYLTMKDRYYTENTNSVKTIVVTTNILKFWQKALIYFGVISFLLNVLYLIFKLRKLWI